MSYLRLNKGPVTLTDVAEGSRVKTPHFKADLICHGDSRCAALKNINTQFSVLPDGGLRIQYNILGDISLILIPAPKASSQVDGLWEHTCFEAFLGATHSDAYREFNFSPSGQWAAYDFSAYRKQHSKSKVATPDIRVVCETHRMELTASVAAADLPINLLDCAFQVNLTAVIEAKDGSKSYWALRHASPQPDFHQRSGFFQSNRDFFFP